MYNCLFFLVINRLQQEGIATFLLSGDRKEAVESIGRTVGIRNENIKSSLTPQGKAGIISTLQGEGRRVAMVMYCGVLFLIYYEQHIQLVYGLLAINLFCFAGKWDNYALSIIEK